MAENAKSLTEYFLENDDECDVEDNRNTSDEEEGEEGEGGRGGDEIVAQKSPSSSSSSPFFSQQWPQSFRFASSSSIYYIYLFSLVIGACIYNGSDNGRGGFSLTFNYESLQFCTFQCEI